MKNEHDRRELEKLRSILGHCIVSRDVVGMRLQQLWTIDKLASTMQSYDIETQAACQFMARSHC